MKFIREPIAEIFRREGFTVIEAADAAEALRVLQTGTTINLVFTDVVMPGRLNGLSLTEWLLINSPATPVILTSSADRLHEIEKIVPRAHFLPKPYRSQELVARAQFFLKPRDDASFGL